MIKTITALFLFYQLISVTFLQSNKPLNRNVVRKPYTHILKPGMLPQRSLLFDIYIYIYIYIFSLRGEQGTTLYQCTGQKFIFIKIT